MTLRTGRTVNRLCVFLLVAGITWATCPRVVGAEPVANPKVCMEKLGSMPDYCQRNQKYGDIPGDGWYYCGPASLSNALIWLARNGYPRLVMGSPRAERTQLELINTLGGPEFIGVDPLKGTSPLKVMRGLDAYADRCGYRANIQWKGWRTGGPYTVGTAPEEAWMLDGVRGKSNVLLEIGWYTQNAQTGVYERSGGHFVTVAGFDIRLAKLHKLFVHDPGNGSVARVRLKNDVCTLAPITRGTLARWSNYPERSAVGYFILKGIALKKETQVAIVDGAIRFTLEERVPASRPAQ